MYEGETEKEKREKLSLTKTLWAQLYIYVS